MIRIHMILFVICFFASFQTFSQNPPPPPGGGHGSGNNQAPGGGGAPVDGSPFILPLLAAGYGIIRWYGNRNDERV